jgi:hypothetical protein
MYVTEDVHSTAVKVDVYPDEFRPIMKAVKYALLSDDRDLILNHEEWAKLNDWLGALSDIARENAV